MNLKLSLSARNARLQALVSELDADDNPGYIEFYTSPQPATGGGAITTQTKIGTCVLSKPSGSVSNGELTFAAIADDLAADNTDTITWARFYDGAGAWVMDGDCGNDQSNALIRFNTVNALLGGTIEILSGLLIEGNV